MTLPRGCSQGAFRTRRSSLAPPIVGRCLRPSPGAGVSAGATYDGLIALEAKAHGRTLLTLDARALETYRRLGAPSRTIIA